MPTQTSTDEGPAGAAAEAAPGGLPDAATLSRWATEMFARLPGAPVASGATGVPGAPGPLAADKSDPPDAACVDVSLRPYDRNSGVAEAMQAYLDWEIDLVREIERDGTVRFGVPTLA